MSSFAHFHLNGPFSSPKLVHYKGTVARTTPRGLNLSRQCKKRLSTAIKSDNFSDVDESMFVWDEDLNDAFGDLDEESEFGETDGFIEGDDIDPCRGSVVYKRSAAETVFEVETSLESLDLAKLSSEESAKVAQGFGSSSNQTGFHGTLVFVSLDVEKRDRELRLEGEASTAMTVLCRRCAMPAVQKVQAPINLLLSPEPVLEPKKKTVGVILGTEKYEAEHVDEEGAGSLDLDIDNRVHFPSEEKEVDISKQVRDSLHLEIPFSVLCQPKCKGLCVICGSNLNVGSCKCSGTAMVDSRFSVLEKLRGPS